MELQNEKNDYFTWKRYERKDARICHTDSQSVIGVIRGAKLLIVLFRITGLIRGASSLFIL